MILNQYQKCVGTFSTVQSMALALLLVAAVPTAIAQEDHSQHRMAPQNQDHDHSSMTQEQFDELREKVEFYRELPNEAIVASMSRMRNMGGMISDADVIGDVGILALAHGYTDEGNVQWMEKFDSVSETYPTAYGLGMAMMGGEHIQRAIDGLEAAGAKTILVLRTETGEANSLVYQWEYIFGRRDEASYLAGQRVTTNADIIWGPSPTAHPIMADIMLDHARALSSNPENELVMIMGHGAMTKKENDMDLEILSKHAAQIKDKGGFQDVKYWNVQDDLPPDGRAANVTKIRAMIQEAKDQGRDVIVVTNVLTQSGVMGRLKADADGLGAKFSDRGLMQNPLFSEWIKTALEENISNI